MAVTVDYYDHENKKLVEKSEKFPHDVYQLWEYSRAQSRYLPSSFQVKVLNGHNYLRLQLWSGYLRCCGMREFGDVRFSSNNPETNKALVKELFNHPWFKQQRIGALLYTKVRFGPNEDSDRACVS